MMPLDSPPFAPIASDLLQLDFASDLPPTGEFSTLGARRRADINQISLAAVLAWLRAEYAPSAQVWPNISALPSFWELVTGAAIVSGAQRFVLIPTEAIDASELRVPQEWVDIAAWSADYYLLLQVNSDAACVSVIGYTTHYHLKTQGQYDMDDRTYSLASDQLIADINVLWLAQQFCPDEQLRAAIAPLTTLEQTQADNLLTRLGNAAMIFPRLAVPFAVWGSLLAHGGWRQRLYERRQGYAEQWSMQQWFETGLSQWAKQLGWQQQRLVAPTGLRSVETIRPCLSRPVLIAGNSYQLQIGAQGDVADRVWRFELTSTEVDQLIPAGITLRLLTEDLQPFAHNSDTATGAIAAIYVDVMLAPDEGIVWETDPLPDQYDREILRF